jgi:hypothetical protein
MPAAPITLTDIECARHKPIFLPAGTATAPGKVGDRWRPQLPKW